MKIDTFHTPNGDGWRILIKKTVDPDRFDPGLKPLAIVPGYGMNSFIFGYHPHGKSMEEYFAAKGLEVWSMNFRAQEGAINEGGSTEYSMGDIALYDLPAAADFIMDNTQSERDKLDMIGCSLGGTYVFIYAALTDSNPLGSIIPMGAPLRWVAIHPVLKAVFGRAWLLKRVRMKHTRRLCRYALPAAAKIPRLLHIYIHPKIVDLSQPEMLTKTVEDPNARLNEEIAHWVRNKDLVIRGVNISDKFSEVTNPILCVLANADGIVPDATALSVLDLASSDVKDVLTVGTEEIRLAHADMFVSNYAQGLVFEPLSEWILDHQ